jgi:hypothetical protein
MIRRIVACVALAAFAMFRSPAPCLGEENPKLAAEDAMVAKAEQRLATLSADDRREFLVDLLGSDAPAQRALAARHAKTRWDLALLGDLEAALEREKAPIPAKALEDAIDQLRHYEKIVLPEEELATLLPVAKPDKEALLDELGFGPVDLRLEICDARGDPVAGARCLVYSRDYCLRVPAEGFAIADDKGVMEFELARGVWSVVAFSDPEYQEDHPDSGVFLEAAKVELKGRRETLALEPDAELTIELGPDSDLNAQAVHVIDRFQGHQVRFPTLGIAAGRFVLEATAGAPLVLSAYGRGPDGQAWIAEEAEVKAPAELRWDPLGPGAARIALKTSDRPKRVKDAEVTLARSIHGPTLVKVEDLGPGSVVFASPGRVELDYAAQIHRRRYEYAPRAYDLRAGETLTLELDAPTTATVFHQHYPGFYGKVRNVLAAGLIAKDVNGHLLARVLHEDTPATITLTARLDGEIVGQATSDKGRFMQKMAQDVDPDILPRLTYEIDAPLGNAIPTTLPGRGWAPFETKHVTIWASPPLVDRIALLGEGIEILYEELVDLRGDEPRWERTGLFFRTIMPPTSGGRATRQGVIMPFVYLLTARWLDIESIKKVPHELEHKFGFGHQDYMGIWANALYERMRHSETPLIAEGPPPGAPVMKAMLAMMRGEPGAAPNAVPWIIYGLRGLEPFRHYQNTKNLWSPALQGEGFTDEEAHCAIFSEAAGAEFRPLYELAGAIIRPGSYERAREAADKLHAADPQLSGEPSEVTDLLLGTSAEGPTPEEELNAAMKAAREKGGEEGAQLVMAKMPLAEKIRMNRGRCKMYMRLGALFVELDAEQEACEAFRNVQREAAKVSAQYVNLCRRLAIIGLKGDPPGIGHM